MLQIAMNCWSRPRNFRLRRLGVAAEGFLSMEAVDRFLQGSALDEGHGVERPVVVLAQAVDRDDAGVLQPGGDGRLAEEPPPRRVVELVGPDPLERHRRSSST